MRFLGQELPYQLTVTLEAFELTDDRVNVGALIWLEKENHKAIVIGKGGSKLKKVGIEARLDIERYFERKQKRRDHLCSIHRKPKLED